MSVRHTSLMLIAALAAVTGSLQAADPLQRCLEGETRVVELPELGRHLGNMLRLQVQVHTATVALNEAVQGKKVPHRDLVPKLLELSRKQQAVVDSARQTIRYLEKETASVAFVEVAREMQEQMRQVAARLARGELGPDTQKLQKEIIDILNEALNIQDS
ncbi:MAG: hypothetical protein AB7K24_25240 [Gemmataceae bacterium]